MNFHPHLHVMAIDGAFSPQGVVHALPTMILAPREALFRHRMFKMLMKNGLLSPERAKLMGSWEHSGFNVDASVRIGADDETGRGKLARDPIRAPFSADKIVYSAAGSTVIRETKRVGANGSEVLFDPLDPLATVASHLPNRGEHLVQSLPGLLQPDAIIAFIEDQRVVRATPGHLSLWDESRPRPPPRAL